MGFEAFPSPAPPADASADEQRAYVQSVRAWRERLIEILGHVADVSGRDLAMWPTRAVGFLRWILAEWWPDHEREWSSRLAYDIRPFPTAMPDEQSADELAAHLAWHAVLVDLVSDAWDVPAHVQPLLDIEECRWLETWIRPTSPQPLCVYCLRPFPREKLHVDAHQCPLMKEMRAKWPPFPPK
jgi:hypothetical protein